MTKTKWHRGAPHSIGWWPASATKNQRIIRWWNGEWWSVPAFPEFSAHEAADVAHFKADFQPKIQWTKRWWV